MPNAHLPRLVSPVPTLAPHPRRVAPPLPRRLWPSPAPLQPLRRLSERATRTQPRWAWGWLLLQRRGRHLRWAALHPLLPPLLLLPPQLQPPALWLRFPPSVSVTAVARLSPWLHLQLQPPPRLSVRWRRQLRRRRRRPKRCEQQPWHSTLSPLPGPLTQTLPQWEAWRRWGHVASQAAPVQTSPANHASS